MSPEQTLARLKPFFRPLGITRIANITGLDCIGIPVTAAYRPNARSLSVSQGKGTDLHAARASAAMEALELYHAEHLSTPLLYLTWNEIRHERPVVPVETLPQLSVSRFTPNLSLLWSEGRDLLAESASGAPPLWVPFELVHTNYEQPFPPGSGCFLMTSNGLASGNDRVEAVCHGLCELIERDAATLFAFRALSEQHACQVRLDSISDPECLGLLAAFERAGVAVGVWDITTDVGMPVFLSVIQDLRPDGFRPLRPVEGMGCHPVREVALIRALTEAAQARLTLIAGSRDDSREHYLGYRPADVSTAARERLQRRGDRAFHLTHTFEHDTFEEDLVSILEALRGIGIRHAIMVDLTKPSFGVPVVRMVVPGLEAYRHAPGYVPGARALTLLEARKRASAP